MELSALPACGNVWTPWTREAACVLTWEAACTPRPTGLPTPQINGAACNPTHKALCTLTYRAACTPDPLGLPPPGPTALPASQTHAAACIRTHSPACTPPHIAACIPKPLVSLQPGLMGLPAPRTLGSACNPDFWGAACLQPRLPAVPSCAEPCRQRCRRVGEAKAVSPY